MSTGLVNTQAPGGGSTKCSNREGWGLMGKVLPSRHENRASEQSENENPLAGLPGTSCGRSSNPPQSLPVAIWRSRFAERGKPGKGSNRRLVVVYCWPLTFWGGFVILRACRARCEWSIPVRSATSWSGGTGQRTFLWMMLMIRSSSRRWLRLAREPAFGIMAKQTPGTRQAPARNHRNHKPQCRNPGQEQKRP